MKLGNAPYSEKTLEPRTYMINVFFFYDKHEPKHTQTLFQVLSKESPIYSYFSRCVVTNKSDNVATVLLHGMLIHCQTLEISIKRLEDAVIRDVRIHFFLLLVYDSQRTLWFLINKEKPLNKAWNHSPYLLGEVRYYVKI